ncbi:hypothetical protein [Clostridium neonatale]|uniref:Uncharacterized protein n=1 Tax=Clostridium neonatale TaxID=137838 RepID=A0AA86JRK8_9CLOT|nr:hypothetical protein CNEO_45045 [Clostridium neonatale]
MSDVISSSNTENILSEAQSSENIKNGWVLENDKWYYYEGNKKLTTEWVKSNDRWYYLEKMDIWLKTGFRLQRIMTGIMHSKMKLLIMAKPFMKGKYVLAG